MLFFKIKNGYSVSVSKYINEPVEPLLFHSIPAELLSLLNDVSLIALLGANFSSSEASSFVDKENPHIGHYSQHEGSK